MTKIEIIQNFVRSMEHERYRRGLTQAEMANKLGMSASAYRKLINGETLNINIHTVATMEKMTGKLLYELVGAKGKTAEIIQNIRNLSEQQKEFVLNIIAFEAGFASKHPTDFVEYVTVIVPSGDVKDGMIWDSANFEKINIAYYKQIFGNRINNAIKITSNHLHPTYVKNDILLIERKPPRNGDVGIFINQKDRRAYIRKYLQTEPCRLEPVNNFGETFYVKSEDIEDLGKWLKYGRIICKIR